MEANGGAGIGRLDCYEDMFKEITRKLYGEDPDHRTSSVQNEFEASVSYKTEEDAGNGTDCSEDDKWTLDDEPLKGTDGSRIAAYQAATSTWRCYECGECMGGGSREVAEHFMEAHSTRLAADEASRAGRAAPRPGGPHHGKEHSAEAKLDEVVAYLERLRERAGLPPRRTQHTQTLPATLLPVAPAFLLHELPAVPPSLPHHIHQQVGVAAMPVSSQASPPGLQQGPTSASSSNSASNSASNSTGSPPSAASAAASASPSAGGSGNNASGKRYTCVYCPYGTDRRDLYTRHENIHREDKPFHCYVCYKPFSRADHVKKHFLRMHREHTYELSRIRKPAGSPAPKQQQQHHNHQPTPQPTEQSGSPGSQAASPYYQPKQQQQQSPSTTTYQLQPAASNSVQALYQVVGLSSAAVAAAAVAMQQQQPEPAQQPSRNRLQNGGGSSNAKGHSKSAGSGSSKHGQERRYSCCYCSWTGVDNWCLKRHLNTHLKPFACALCEYKAARAERLSTHVFKVHNRRQCSRCSFLAEDYKQLQNHLMLVHKLSSTGIASSVPPPPSNPQPALNQQQQQQQQQPQTISNQSNSNEQHHSSHLPMHPAAGGRPPPGPPVFPASSAAIAPATTVIPPTTILGAAVVAATRW